MTSKKKSEEGTRRNNRGKDADDWVQFTKKINPLNKVTGTIHNADHDFLLEKRDPVKAVKKFFKDI